jgi:hypothetical protein
MQGVLPSRISHMQKSRLAQRAPETLILGQNWRSVRTSNIALVRRDTPAA